MLKQVRQDHAAQERILAQGLREVAAELRLVDAADLVAFIRTGKFGSLRSLVSAATEMYFLPGMMSLRNSGNVTLGWTGEPSIALDMNFRHPAVEVHFQLVLEPRQAGVEIEYISFSHKSAGPRENAQRLEAAIANARFQMPGDLRLKAGPSAEAT